MTAYLIFFIMIIIRFYHFRLEIDLPNCGTILKGSSEGLVPKYKQCSIHSVYFFEMEGA